MRIRRNVFGSEYERSLFQVLQNRWSDKVSLYHNLPFLRLIDIGQTEVASAEFSYLLKTSVDFTLCGKDDEPLMAIEFDGLGGGFSQRSKYVPYESTPQREWGMNLKLRICGAVRLPLFVIGQEESVPIHRNIKLAVVDALIGSVLASGELTLLANRYVEDDAQIIANMSPDEQYEHIQDLVLQAEVTADLEWNPLVQEAARLTEKLDVLGLYKGSTHESLYDPPMPDGDPFTDVQVLRARVDALTTAKRLGACVTIHTGAGSFAATTWMRAIEGPGASAFSLVHELAELLALKNAADELLVA